MGVSRDTGSKLGGSGAIYDAVALLANPVELKARMDSLAAAEASAREVIDAVGPASEILKLRKEAEALVAAAKAERQAATADARALVVQAETQATKIRRDANDHAARVESQANDLMKMVNEQRSKLDADRSSVDGKLESVAVLLDEIETTKQDLDNERAKLLELRAVLNADRVKVDNVLARLKVDLS